MFYYGTPGGNVPIIGHTNIFIKKPAGFEKSWKNLLELKEQGPIL